MSSPFDPVTYIDKVTIIIERGDDVVTLETLGKVVEKEAKFTATPVLLENDILTMLTTQVRPDADYALIEVILPKCLPNEQGEFYNMWLTKKSDNA